MLKLDAQHFGIDIRNFTQGGKIGLGGYSDVYLTQYKKNGENYAAKVIKSNVFKEDEKNKIEDEIKIMSLIDHPTIIQYLGYSLLDFNLNPNIVIFTQLVKNGSLNKIILKAKQSNLPENYDNTTRQIILIGIASGMKYLHNKNIMHCDLKTNNILLDDNYYPHIIDFGMAKYINENSLVEDDLVCGTLPYMAPEMILGHKYSYKIDVYAFAMIMYEVICELDLYPNLDYNQSLTEQFKKHVAVSNKRPRIKIGVKNCIRFLIQQCWSSKANERPTFDEIYNKLIDPKYYLDNVDEKRIKEYLAIITKNDISDSNNSDLIQKVRTLSKENENLREQVSILKENNEKLLNENDKMKNTIEEMMKKVEAESEITVKPPPVKDEHMLINSRFLHLKEKKEELEKANSDQFLSSQKETENEELTKDIDNLKEEIKERTNSPKRSNLSSSEEEIKEISNSPKRPIHFSNEDEIRERSNSPKRPIHFSNEDEIRERSNSPNRSIQSSNEEEIIEKTNSPKRSNQSSNKEEIKEKINSPKRSIQFSNEEEIKKRSNSPKRSIQFSNEDEIKERPISPKRSIRLSKDSSKEKINGQSEKRVDCVKLPSLNRLKKSDSLTISDFNSLSLQQQYQIIKIKSNSMSFYSRNYYIINLHTLLDTLIQFVKCPETAGYIEIQANESQTDADIDKLNQSNRINILHKATEILYYHKLFNNSEFKEILNLFRDQISIEIKYYSKIYQGIYETISTMKHVNINIFISGIKKTDNTFKNNKCINSIRFDNSVINIIDYAFKNCDSLTHVVIPSSVTSIGSGSFEGCDSLKSISIPSSITFIDFSVFKNCTNLADVCLSNSIKMIRDNAFYGCSSLKKLTLPSFLAAIGEFAFYNCASLESITIPPSVTSIGKGAFGKCSGLKHVSIPSSVKSIGKGAFEGCSSLVSIKIPSSIKNMNELDIKPKCHVILI